MKSRLLIIIMAVFFIMPCGCANESNSGAGQNPKAPERQESTHDDGNDDLTSIMAELGDIDAQISVGSRYVYGEGVEQNFTEAMEWLRVPAELGNPDAAYYIAECYRLQGDFSSAVEWYELAEGQGHMGALSNLGNCYFIGLGVPADTLKAIEYYKKAGLQGDVNCQYNVGICYAKGYGIEQNSDEAVKWLKMSASQNYARAINALQDLYGIYMDYNE